MKFLVAGGTGTVGSQVEVERLTEILGHPPRSFHDYAAERAESWL